MIEAQARVSLEQGSVGFVITKSQLVVRLTAQADEDALMQAARAAPKNCPISKRLNAEITMDVQLT